MKAYPIHHKSMKPQEIAVAVEFCDGQQCPRSTSCLLPRSYQSPLYLEDVLQLGHCPPHRIRCHSPAHGCNHLAVSPQRNCFTAVFKRLRTIFWGKCSEADASPIPRQRREVSLVTTQLHDPALPNPPTPLGFSLGRTDVLRVDPCHAPTACHIRSRHVARGQSRQD